MGRKQRSFEEFFSKSKSHTENVDIEIKHYNTLGKCFSVRPKIHVVRLGIVQMEITSHMDIYVYMGYPGQFMHSVRARVRTNDQILIFGFS